MANEIANIKNIKEIVGGVVNVNDDLTDNYCPNRRELMDNSIVQYYNISNSGILINGNYNHQQCVLKDDVKLELKPAIEVNYLVLNDMPTPPYSLQSAWFYFNNGKVKYINIGGGLVYGSTRKGVISGVTLESDFPLTITSYKYMFDIFTDMIYEVNISPYTLLDYRNGLELKITIKSYI